MTFCDEHDGGCGASLTATDYEAGFCTQCKRRLSAKESEIMTRIEHLAWAKERALEYVDSGDLQNAFTSLASDLNKHPETAGHMGIEPGMMQMMGGMLNTPEQMRKFIEDFN